MGIKGKFNSYARAAPKINHLASKATIASIFLSFILFLKIFMLVLKALEFLSNGVISLKDTHFFGKSDTSKIKFLKYSILSSFLNHFNTIFVHFSEIL
jgi:hypothetical protein